VRLASSKVSPASSLLLARETSQAGFFVHKLSVFTLSNELLENTLFRILLVTLVLGC